MYPYGSHPSLGSLTHLCLYPACKRYRPTPESTALCHSFMFSTHHHRCCTIHYYLFKATPMRPYCRAPSSFPTHYDTKLARWALLERHSQEMSGTVGGTVAQLRYRLFWIHRTSASCYSKGTIRASSCCRHCRDLHCSINSSAAHLMNV